MWASASSRISSRRARRRVAAVPLRAQRAARVLGLDDVAQLVERQAEQVLQAQDLREPLDVCLAVEPVAPASRSAVAGSRPSSS